MNPASGSALAGAPPIILALFGGVIGADGAPAPDLVPLPGTIAAAPHAAGQAIHDRVTDATERLCLLCRTDTARCALIIWPNRWLDLPRAYWVDLCPACMGDLRRVLPDADDCDLLRWLNAWRTA